MQFRLGDGAPIAKDITYLFLTAIPWTYKAIRCHPLLFLRQKFYFAFHRH
jgi:hypothetical protein